MALMAAYVVEMEDNGKDLLRVASEPKALSSIARSETRLGCDLVAA